MGQGPLGGMRLPELLAPAGDWECVRAAVENGADAVYFGLSRFNARMRAQNFTEADLPALMEYLHTRGVRGYVTFNTLVFENELTEAEDYLRAIIAAGVDAAIVQDVGICRMIRNLSPDFPIHASTQMTITSLAGVQFARELGCSLVVLARECSISEIEKIRASDTGSELDPKNVLSAPSAEMPLEVFVHGALCVAYSGQCLTSEALGGRSANRGECAQACRLPYELVSDGQPVSLGDRKYLLSPQDLAGVEVLPDLIRSGVASLKIEGRLKSAEYVANITRVYRQALDRWASNNVAPETGSPLVDADMQYDLEMGFSRGLFTGWFRGNDNQKLVHARFGKKRGVYIGKVLKVTFDEVQVQLEGAIKPGDGVVFDAGKPEQPEQGGFVYQVLPRGQGAKKGSAAKGDLVALRFGREALDLRRVRPGERIWKTSDPELDRRVRQTYQGETIRFHRPLRFEVFGALGEPLRLVGRDELGHVAEGVSSLPLVAAQTRPLTEATMQEPLSRLGNTPFFLKELRSSLPAGLMLPISELNRIRRDVVDALLEYRRSPKRWTLLAPADPADVNVQTPRVPADSGGPELAILVRSRAQLAAVLALPIRTIYCEFEDPKKYRDAVALVRSTPELPTTAFPPGTVREVFVATPRIFKSGEEWILKIVESAEPDGFLVRNYEHLKAFRGRRCVGDFSLNVANSLAASVYMQAYPLERVTASYDLNVEQLEALLRGAPPSWFEVTLHQHIPMFHMEHCVFCAFLSKGKDYHDCGRPCEKHEVQLRDRVGSSHPLKADAGCRNTVFNAQAQSGAEFAQRFLDLGLRRFRIEFLLEDAATVAQTIGLYQKLLAGQISGSQLWRELKIRSQLGVTRGALEKRELARG